MESVGQSQGRSDFGGPREHTPYESEREDSRRPLMAPTEVSMNQGLSPQCIRFSVIGELKEYNGRDLDEDRTRSWISKVKSPLLRKRIPAEEKCLGFGYLLTGPTQNWHRQLSRTALRTWKDLLEGFMVQYGGYGVSNARQYYHARKRPDETPLAYLHRLNGAAIRAKFAIREGRHTTRRGHVEHFISTLDDRDLAKQLTLLRLSDADDMEETLRAYQRMKNRYTKASMGPRKWHQRSKFHADQIPSKSTRAVRAIRVESESSSSESKSSGSEEYVDLRRVGATTVPTQVKLN